ncbi:Oxidoreductase, molybdopterin-binding domain-containing protein [Pavlovales sp. CCMP2436]|nr:Oxidoreductase, molybdopterin-binding domain-containing protein [Pavlovales sp. CCMP2436]
MQQGFICPPQLHYVRNHGAVPVKFETAEKKQQVWEDWRIDVVGLVDKPLKISMAELKELPFRQLPVLLVCAGNRRKEQNMVKQTIGFSWGPTAWATTIWGGCRLCDLLSAAGVKDDPEGKLHVHFRGPAGELPKGDDGSYGTSVPLYRAMDPSMDIMVVWEQNGRSLMPDHGFPVRLIIPGYIGGRMIKWLCHIEVGAAESSNFYHFMDNRVLPVGVTPESATAEGWWYKPDYIINELNINSAMASPAHDETLAISPDSLGEVYTIKGYAYSGGGKKVIRCEISLDSGVTWEGGVVEHPETPTEYGKYWCHCLWSFSVSISRLLAAKEVCCRAWDNHMNTQPNHLTWNVMGMLNNPIFRIKIHRSYARTSVSELRFEHPTMPGKQPGGWMVEPPQPAVSPLVSGIRRIASGLSLSRVGSSVALERMNAPPLARAPSASPAPALASMNEIAAGAIAKTVAVPLDPNGTITLEEIALHTTKSYDEVGHSDNAEKILMKFKIGELPKPPGLLDGVPIVPILCALGGAIGMLGLRALALRRK